MINAIFISVRTASTRLPRKALIKICGITAIEHLINRVKQSKKVNKITTIEKISKIRAQLIKTKDVKVKSVDKKVKKESPEKTTLLNSPSNTTIVSFTEYPTIVNNAAIMGRLS